MSNNDKEQALRREAIRRRLAGEQRQSICQALGRSPRWFDKWWGVYRRDVHTDFADQSRAPRTSPQRLSEETEQLIVSLRERLVAGQEAAMRYECIGARAIVRHLRALGHAEIPSRATVQRVLARHGLTQPTGAGAPQAYYPWLHAQAVNDILATDLVTRHVRGGQEEVISFHTLDHYSRAVYLSQHADKSAATARQHLQNAYACLGLPLLHQFDNESSFCGGHAHRRVFGQVVRLCLFCGVEPVFTPFYDPQRNYQVEDFNSLWAHAFWARHEFASAAEVTTEAARFLDWYLSTYDPPALDGRTPAQVRCGAVVHPLDAARLALIPDPLQCRLPLTAGYLHFMRKVDASAHIELLNERWPVRNTLVGCYVRATIDIAAQRLSIWHKPDPLADWRRVSSRVFRVQEPVHDLLPAFRFKPNRARCRELYPA